MYIAEPCWACQPPIGYCAIDPHDKDVDIVHGEFILAVIGKTGTVSTPVAVPGGGPYKLAYQLYNAGGHKKNSWQAIIEPSDGPPFPAVFLDTLKNAAAFNWTPREFPFSLPPGTKSVRLTFQARHVRPGKPPLTAKSHPLPPFWL